MPRAFLTLATIVLLGNAPAFAQNTSTGEESGSDNPCSGSENPCAGDSVPDDGGELKELSEEEWEALMNEGQEEDTSELSDAPPILYGGARPDPSLAQDVKKRVDALPNASELGPPAWFLDGFEPLDGNLFLLNSGTVWPCKGEPVSVEEIRTLVEEGERKYLEEVDIQGSVLQYEEAMRKLSCVQEIVPNQMLVDLFFGHAIGILYSNPGNDRPAREAFKGAHRVRGDLDWNNDYDPKDAVYFYQARDELLRSGRAQMWSLITTVPVHLNGIIVPAGEPLELLPGRHVLQISLVEGRYTAWVDVPAGAQLVLSDPDTLWTRITDTGEAAGEENTLAARRALARKARGDYWLAVDPDPLKVVGQTGALAVNAGLRERYKPKFMAGVGAGYHWYDKTAFLAYSDSPRAHWVGPQAEIGVRVLSQLDIHGGGGLVFGGTGSDEVGEFTELLPFGFFGVGFHRPLGPVRPGGRVDLLMYFPGNEFTDNNNDLRDDRPFDIFVGPRASFTLDFVPKSSAAGVQLEMAFGWAGTLTAHGQLKMLLGRR